MGHHKSKYLLGRDTHIYFQVMSTQDQVITWLNTKCYVFIYLLHLIHCAKSLEWQIITLQELQILYITGLQFILSNSSPLL